MALRDDPWRTEANFESAGRSDQEYCAEGTHKLAWPAGKHSSPGATSPSRYENNVYGFNAGTDISGVTICRECGGIERPDGDRIEFEAFAERCCNLNPHDVDDGGAFRGAVEHGSEDHRPQAEH